MSYWYMARVELHEQSMGNLKGVRPDRSIYDRVHKALRKPAFSRIVVLNAKSYQLPDATYERAEQAGDTVATISAAATHAVDSVWPSSTIVVVRFTDTDVRYRLMAAPQSLIDFELQNPVGR